MFLPQCSTEVNRSGSTVRIPALMSGIRRSIPHIGITIVVVSRHSEGVVVGMATQVEKGPLRSTDLYSLQTKGYG